MVLIGRRISENRYDMSGEYGVGYASNTGSPFYFDKSDFETVRYHYWNEHILTNGYHALEAWDKNKRNTVRMHWLLCGKRFDHINRNPLDNRRCNLRKADQSKNVLNRSRQKSNTSGVTGVYFMKDRSMWRSQISIDGQRFHKDFYTFEDAVNERLRQEKMLFGEFAPQVNTTQTNIKAGVQQ